MKSNRTSVRVGLFVPLAVVALIACEPPSQPVSSGSDGATGASADASIGPDVAGSEGGTVEAISSSLLRCGPGTKACGNSCIGTASCCGGCSGATPVCSNGTCVKKSCPTNQALCGGTTCVDTYSTASHCGASCLQCAGATAECYQGGCVECLNNADCQTAAHTGTLGSQAMCSTSIHRCVCALEEPGNVIINGGFDSSIAGWKPASDGSSTLTWAGGDGFQCQSSGSASVTGFNPLQQCAKIKANTRYYFGASYFDSGSGVDCGVEYHANPTCTDDPLGFTGFMGRVTNAWTHLGGPTMSPSNATNALVTCAQWDGGQANVDQIYLNSANDSF